jgi:hypothetical protein
MILKKDTKALSKYLNALKSNRYDMPSIIFYHGTSTKHDILDKGILTTTSKTAKSLSSTFGYTYLSIYPDHAYRFGDLAYPYGDITVYEVKIPANLILPDKDQIYLMNRESGQNITDNLANSIIYGDGVRVKGDIPPYMISEYKKYKR